MQPSAKWKTINDELSGLSRRTGAADLSNADYENYPPFASSYYTGAAGEQRCMFWKYNYDDFPLNSAITDYSIAYTAVNNPELSHNNIGVFLADETTPDYITDNTLQQPIAFCYSQRYQVLLNNVAGVPNLTDYGRFKEPPYTNSRYVWKPDAGGAKYSGNLTDFYINANTLGYAVQYARFGIKSLFLEIRVIADIDRSLANYESQEIAWRATHPIRYAYCKVHRRANINGTYSITAGDYGDINTVMFLPFIGNNMEIHCYYNNIRSRAEYNDCYLPLWGVSIPIRTYARYDSNNHNGDFFYGADRIDDVEVTEVGDGTFLYQMYLNGTAENIEYLRKCCAAYGLFFCDDVYIDENTTFDDSSLEANNGRWLHDKMHLGIIEDNGYTEGRYTTGALNALQTQFQWSDSTDSIYDPAYPPEPQNEYNTQTVFNTVSGISTMTQRYAMTAGAVKNLGAALWSISADLIDDGGGGEDYSELNEKILDTFLTNNPIDCIVSLRKYPFEISKDDSTFIKLGKYETTVGAYTMSKTLEIFEFRMRNEILPIFNDSFMDYEPYTHFELYVPFCGTVSVEPADILGRQLSVKLAVDYSTGTCTAYILTDDLVIKTISGQIAIDIPVSGIQSVTAASQINNAIAQASTAQKNEQTSKLSLMTIGGMGQLILNPAKAGNNISTSQIESQRADYELQHQNIQPHLIGSASSAASWLIDFSCRLLIYYPTGEILFNNNNPPTFNPVKLLEYGHTVGFACCNTGTLSSFSGLTVAVKADLNGITTNSGTRPATLQELQMLEAALNEGVIL